MVSVVRHNQKKIIKAGEESKSKAQEGSNTYGKGPNIQ
jgi:hypothetical protein